MFQGTTQLPGVEVPYTLDVALATARADSGLADFGEEVFIEPLQKLIEYSLAEVRFTPLGLFNFKATVHRFLVNRLRLQRDLRAHPEILDEDVSDPIIILGMPRTGTTKLQRLMSADPRMQKLALWKLLNPAPFDDERDRGPIGRLAFAKAVEDATRANPEFTMSHETSAEEADEDSYLALMSFDYVMLYCIFPSPSYLAWVRSRPQREAHLLERRFLQYLQWQDGGRRGRRWVLKNPGAVGFLRVLHETFPRAVFIHSHREMTEVIPSYCRLMESIYAPLVEATDLGQLGQDVLDYWAPEMQRYVRERAALQGKVEIIDVPYQQIVADPLVTVRLAYEQAGLQLTTGAVAAMDAWSQANGQHKFGKTDYSLERYGLTREAIERAFAER